MTPFAVRRAVLLLCAMLYGVVARPALAHPLHTSLAAIKQSGSSDFTVSLRVFADDFHRHTGARDTADGSPPDERIVTYLMRTFVIIDRSGRGIPLKWCGSERVADLLVICLSGRIDGGLRGARVRYSVLCDLFPDQVNILQVSTDARRQSILFTPAETTRLIG